MTTPITNYTTYDLAYYYADLKQLAPLSQEQRNLLLSSVSADQTTCSCTDAERRQHLIESYLPLVKHLAITLCPPLLSQRLFPDLIGAGNLAVVEAVTRAGKESILHLDGYVTAYVRGAIKHTIVRRELLTIPHRVIERAQREGTLDDLYVHCRVASLDERMHWFQTQEVEEPLLTSITPAEAAPPRDPEQRAQVDILLSYLSPRAQAILRLRYGLGDDNEHRHTTNEIVQLLRLDRKAILLTERDAIARLKAFVTGKATLGTKNGKTCIRYPGAQKTYTLTPEQETSLRHACHDLEAQGVSVTGRSLAKAAKVSVARALLFLRLHSPTSIHPLSETPKHVRARQREARLTQVYTRLQAQRGRVTSSLLAKEAQVKKQTAVDFLKAQKGKVEHAAV